MDNQARQIQSATKFDFTPQLKADWVKNARIQDPRETIPTDRYTARISPSYAIFLAGKLLDC